MRRPPSFVKVLTVSDDLAEPYGCEWRRRRRFFSVPWGCAAAAACGSGSQQLQCRAAAPPRRASAPLAPALPPTVPAPPPCPTAALDFDELNANIIALGELGITGYLNETADL